MNFPQKNPADVVVKKMKTSNEESISTTVVADPDSSYYIYKTIQNSDIEYSVYMSKTRSRNKNPRTRKVPQNFDKIFDIESIPFKKETPYRCLECKEYFITYEIMYQHYNDTHINDIPEPSKGNMIKCKQCKEAPVFYNVSSYKRHFKRVHSINKFPCPRINCNRV